MERVNVNELQFIAASALLKRKQLAITSKMNQKGINHLLDDPYALALMEARGIIKMEEIALVQSMERLGADYRDDLITFEELEAGVKQVAYKCITDPAEVALLNRNRIYKGTLSLVQMS